MTGPEAGFTLDPRLGSETRDARDLPLCRLLLRDEVRFPWVVLVPRRASVRESFDLAEADRARLWEEVDRTAGAMTGVTSADKINIAAFGNMVPQLHVHVVARREDDAAWPGSAIGHGERKAYGAEVPAFWSALVATLREG